MRMNIDGKSVNIPESEIKNNMKLVDTREEAIQIWLEDNGYAVNEEQEALCKKAKDNRITATVHKARVTNEVKREVVRKENPTKEKVIAAVAELLKDFAEEVNIENAAKIITFKMDGNSYKFDLIQRRVKK